MNAAPGLDIYPTVLRAAGVEPDQKYPSDGRDLIPYLEGKVAGAPHDRLYWRSLPSYAVRDQRWKLLANASPGGEMVFMLFDLANDMGEKRDVSKQYPDIVKRLQADFESWSNGMEPARWPTDREFDVEINGVKVRTTN